MATERSGLHSRLERLNAIGIALTAEKDLNRLLEMIVDEARRLTQADAGTLYLRQGEGLLFAIVQNTTLHLRMGGSSGEPISWPPIPLQVNGRPNMANVCAYVAVTGEPVSIADVYSAPGFDFSGTRGFDSRTGYRSESMLTVPLRDYEGVVIGVLQLINAHSSEGTTGFPKSVESLVASLASQAAVAITKARLIKDTEALFEAFVQVMAQAIDERSPSTAGHIKRVSEITLALAQAVNEEKEGPYSGVQLSKDDLSELGMAAWMHDVGKVTTPIHIVEKKTKLEAVVDRIEHVRTRFEVLKLEAENKTLRLIADLVAQGAGEAALKQLELQLQKEVADLEDDLAFVIACNSPVEHMPEENAQRLQEIAQRTYTTGGQMLPVLTQAEVDSLTVRRGNLSKAELALMQEHATITSKLLRQIPFTSKLRQVPAIAGAHHEKLNGKGYPQGLTGAAIPLQARILAIADVFDALTASDRSYKGARTPEEALRILQFMVEDGEIDAELFRIFSSRVAPHITKSIGSWAI